MDKNIEQFFKDREAFDSRWQRIKKCKCENPECSHWRRKYNQTELPQEAVRLFNEGLYENMKSFIEVSHLTGDKNNG